MTCTRIGCVNSLIGYVFLILTLTIPTSQAQDIPYPAFRRMIGVVCFSTNNLNRLLTETLNETHVLQGKITEGGIFDLWVSKDGEFTAVIALDDMTSCVVFGGEALKFIPPRNQGQGL